jgi:hypothetical protein
MCLFRSASELARRVHYLWTSLSMSESDQALEINHLLRSAQIDLQHLVGSVLFEPQGLASLRSDIYCLAPAPSWTYRLSPELTLVFARVAAFVSHLLLMIPMERLLQKSILQGQNNMALVDAILFTHAFILLHEEAQLVLLQNTVSIDFSELINSSSPLSRVHAFYEAFRPDLKTTFLHILSSMQEMPPNESFPSPPFQILHRSFSYASSCPVFLRVLEDILAPSLGHINEHEFAGIVAKFLQKPSVSQIFAYGQYILGRHGGLLTEVSASHEISDLIHRCLYDRRDIPFLVGWFLGRNTNALAPGGLDSFIDWFLTWCIAEQSESHSETHALYFLFSLIWQIIFPQLQEEQICILFEAICIELARLLGENRVSFELYYLLDMFELFMKEQKKHRKLFITETLLDSSRRLLSFCLGLAHVPDRDVQLPRAVLRRIVGAASVIPQAILFEECPIEGLSLCLRSTQPELIVLAYHWLVDVLGARLIADWEKAVFGEGKEIRLPDQLTELIKHHSNMSSTLLSGRELSDDGQSSFRFIECLIISEFLSWISVLRLVSLATRPETRMGILADLKEETESFQLLLDLIFHHLHLDTGYVPLDMSSSDLTNLLREDSFLDTGLDNPRLIYLIALKTYWWVLRVLPAMTRQWWIDCKDRQFSLAIEKFTETYFSLRLIHADMDLLQREIHEKKLFGNTLIVRVNRSSREITASYMIEETSLQLAIRWPSNFPLKPVPAEDLASTRLGGISEGQRFRWLVMVSHLLNIQNASVVDVLWLWKQNLDRRFEGIEPCTICYSMIHMSDTSLPQQQCKICKNKFHSVCLVSRPIILLPVVLHLQSFTFSPSSSYSFLVFPSRASSNGSNRVVNNLLVHFVEICSNLGHLTF